MNQNFMKERPVFPLLLSMGVPVILSMIAGALYNIVDSIFVAKLSEDAMTALSLVFPLQNLAHAAGVGFGVGIGALISRLLGEEKGREADMAASQGVFLSLLHGILFTAAGLAVMPWFLRMFTEDSATIAYGMEYSGVVFFFAAVDTVGMAYEKIYQAVGKMLVSVSSVLLGCFINILLDPVLIFGLGPVPAFGIRGAAWATGLGQTASLLFYLIYYHIKPLNVSLSAKWMRPTKRICGRIYPVGTAAALNIALTSLLLSALNTVLAPFSQVYILVLGVYYKLQALLYQAAGGLVQGMRPLIAYNYGAGEWERVRRIYRAALGIIAAIMMAGFVLCQMAPEFLMGLFTTNSSTVEIGKAALRIVSWGFVLSAVSVTSSGALEGLGQGMASLKISLLRYVIVILPAAYLLSRIMGPAGVWHGFWIAEAVSAVYAAASWRKMQRV